VTLDFAAAIAKAVADANREALTPPASIVREDKDLITFTVEQIAELLSTAIFAKRLGWLASSQRMDLTAACHEFVQAQIDEHVPQPDTEPDAMSEAKYEAES
jgi:hypothetical protein